MPIRRKFQTAHRALEGELLRLIRIDIENQRRRSTTAGRPSAGEISPKQLYLLNESVFFAAYRAFENYMEECFILYTMGVANLSGFCANSYLASRNYNKNREIIKSGNRYLDWNTPETLISRSELLLKDGEPVKSVLVAKTAPMRRLKRIRNHIAHNSEESLLDFKKVLRAELSALPISLPSAGEFLQMRLPRSRTERFLQHFIQEMRLIGSDLAG